MSAPDPGLDRKRLLLMIDEDEVILAKPETGEGGRWAVADLSDKAVSIILSEVTSALVRLMPDPAPGATDNMAELLGLYAGRPPVGGLVTLPPWAPTDTRSARRPVGAGHDRDVETSDMAGAGGQPSTSQHGQRGPAGAPQACRSAPTTDHIPAPGAATELGDRASSHPLGSGARERD